MVKLDEAAHSILKKWKRQLREQGIKVPLGATIREMGRLVKDENVGFSKTDLKAINHALDKLKEISEKYDNPSFSDVIVKMDEMFKGE
jgi:protein-L-isoaspartate O-methyltransferase